MTETAMLNEIQKIIKEQDIYFNPLKIDKIIINKDKKNKLIADCVLR